MKPIAHIYTDFKTKFGLPRQSGLVKEITGKIVFEKQYSIAEAFKGLEDFTHIWILWEFSQAKKETWKPTVRPPLLGGNKRMGVFATRSPFRPNHLGLSSVRLIEVVDDAGRIELVVSGADLVDGTPIYDIKPYVEYSDSHVGVRSGFVDSNKWKTLAVDFPPEFVGLFSPQDYKALCKVLELDPRPQYHNDPERLYGMPFGGYDIHFTVTDSVLTVVDVVKMEQ